jgi:hypothetical protein
MIEHSCGCTEDDGSPLVTRHRGTCLNCAQKKIQATLKSDVDTKVDEIYEAKASSLRHKVLETAVETAQVLSSVYWHRWDGPQDD